MLRRLLVVFAGLLVPLCALPGTAAAKVVVVFPFAVSGTVPPDLGRQISAKIGDEIAALGGVTVVRGSPATKPADYRAVAQAAGAELYFSGSVAPVFTSYSAIENLVSTRTGTVVWSVSMQFRNVADIVGEGERVRTELLRGDAPPPAGVAASGASLVTPSPVSGIALLPVTGSAPAGDRTLTEQTLIAALQSRGMKVVTVSGDAPLDPAADGPAACTQTGARTLIAGSVDTTRLASLGTAPQTTARISLRTYDCTARELEAQATVVNHIAPLAADAIRGAAEDAVSTLPAPS